MAIDAIESKLRPPALPITPYPAKMITLADGEVMVVREAKREEVGVLLFNKESSALGGIPGDSPAGLRAIRQPRGVADEGILRPRQALHERTQHRKAAKSGVEYANRRVHAIKGSFNHPVS